MQLSPMLHECGAGNDRATPTLFRWVVCPIAGDQEIHGTRERHGQKRLIIRVGQIPPALPSGINGRAIHFQLGQHFPHSFGVKLEARTGEDFRYSARMRSSWQICTAPARASLSTWAGFP